MNEVAAEVSTKVHALPTKIWDCLTDLPTLSKYFMGAKVRTDWHVGHSITWSGEWKGEAYEDKGTVMAFDRNKRLSFSHWSAMGGTTDEPSNYHLVDILLDTGGAETEVRLLQTNLEGGLTDADREHRADYEKNWSAMLEGLKQTVEAKA